MSKKEMYEARTEELITPILDRRNFELVDVEYVKEGSTCIYGFTLTKKAESLPTIAQMYPGK